MVSLEKVSVCTERKFDGVSFQNADWKARGVFIKGENLKRKRKEQVSFEGYELDQGKRKI